MNTITILPEHITNKIAAGEVIERPASIVKELVENAIDAHSLRIDVAFDGDGTAMIRVVDNGSGMSKDDAVLCLERHATSKIKTAEDITAINTLGFRGEAMSSIAAVSKLEIVSKEKENKDSGTYVLAEGGKIRAVKEIGVPHGTKITVRQLFYNTPARKKFLKTEQVEANAIITFINTMILAYPEIYFTLSRNGKIVLDAPPVTQVSERVAVVYGRKTQSEMIPLDFKAPAFSLQGFIGKPEFTRTNRNLQTIFVNRRVVQNKAVQFAIKQGYERLIPPERFPAAIIFITISPDLVDVNIHPAKREVKFTNELKLTDSLIKAIQKTLMSKQVLPGIFFKESGGKHEPVQKTGERVSPLPQAVSYAVSEQEDSKEAISFAEPNPLKYQAEQPSLEARPYVKVIGQLKKSYIIAEDENGLLLIDQHAAHERLLFEKLMKEYRASRVASQKLLFPQTIELTKPEVRLLMLYMPVLGRLGFSIREFGDDSVIVEEVPVLLKDSAISGLLIDIISDIQSDTQSKKQERVSDAAAETIIRHCCRRAVKAYDSLTIEEMEQLLHDIFSFNIPFSCPHGRPVGITVSVHELEKRFKRV